MPYFPRPWPVGDPLWGLPCHSLPLGLRQTIYSKTKNITSAKHWNKQKRKQIPRLKKNLFICSGRPSIPGCSWPASPLGGAWSSGRRGSESLTGRCWSPAGIERMRGNNTLPFCSRIFIQIPQLLRATVGTQLHSHSGSLSYLDIPWVFLHMPPYHILCYCEHTGTEDLRGIGVALWHKKGQSSFVRCGPGLQSPGRVLGRVHNRESEQSLGRGKTQVTRCGMGEGGQAPRCGQAMHQSWVHILFILFPGGVFRHFFFTTILLGFFFFFLLLMDSTLHHSHYS